jgi:hypothetical protein
MLEKPKRNSGSVNIAPGHVQAYVLAAFSAPIKNYSSELELTFLDIDSCSACQP